MRLRVVNISQSSNNVLISPLLSISHVQNKLCCMNTRAGTISQNMFVKHFTEVLSPQCLCVWDLVVVD